MGTFETHGRLYQPFPFSTYSHGVCHFLEGRKPLRFFSAHHAQRLLSYENFTFLLDMAAILIQ